jgi:hemolysin activation/secretion protein
VTASAGRLLAAPAPLAVALLLYAPGSRAQVPPPLTQGRAFESFERPGERSLEPRPGESAESPSFSLPEIPPIDQATAATLADSPEIVVREFRVAGSTIFSAAELEAVTAPYLGRPLGSESLIELRDRLTQLYVRAGYVSSGAQLPDQEVRDGVVEYRIVEGRLDEVAVEGNRHLRDRYLIPRLERGAGVPLDVASLEGELQRLQEDPRIRRVDAALLPGERPGEARLRVRVEEEAPYFVALTSDNHESPSIGAYRGQLEVGHRSLTGNGDELRAWVAGSAGLLDYEVAYELPVARWDTALGAWYRSGESKVVEEPFDAVDIESESRTIGLALRQPLPLSRESQLELALLAEYRESETFLLGEPFPFSPGTDDGHSTVAVLRLRQDYVYRDLAQVVALRTQISVGTKALGATESSGALPDGQFVAWLAQAQWVRRLGKLELIARADLQVASSALLSLEQFSVGGHASVRGYRESLLVRDDGVLGSLELRVPLWRNRVASLDLAPFFDVGHAWSASSGGPAPDTLASAGLGLRVEWRRHLRAEIYWAEALTDVFQPPDHDLQDSGVHFQIVASY